MAFGSIVGSWHNKPPLGTRPVYGHPRRQGLVVDLLFNEVGGSQVWDYAQNLSCAIGSGNGVLGVTYKTGPRGGVANVSDAGTGSTTVPFVALGTGANPGGNVFSIATRINLASNGQGTIYGGISNQTGCIELRTDTGPKFTLLRQGLFGFGSSNSFSINTWVDLLLTYNGTLCTYYINGAAAGTSSSAQTFTQTISMKLFRGVGTDTGFPNSSQCEYFKLWNRSLSPTDAVDLVVRPFDDWQVPSTRQWFLPPPPAQAGGFKPYWVRRGILVGGGFV